MPKTRPDHVQVHRIELQSHERDLLDMAVGSYAVGNVLSGVGAVLAPFSAVISAIFAAWIAKEGVEAVVEWLDSKRAESKAKNDQMFRNEYVESGSDLTYAEWLVERKQQRDYRAWAWFQDNGIIAQIRKAWDAPAESTEPTAD